MTIQDKATNLSGVSVHYLEAGQEHGRALLLLHGLGGAQLNWGGVIPALAEHYHVVAPDLPGFNGSDVLPNMRLHALMHWLRALLDSTNIQQAVVVGNSIGGLVARLFAAAEPKYVPSVILVNGGGVPNLPPPVRMIANAPMIGDMVFALFGWMAVSQSSINRMIHVAEVRTPEFARQVSASGRGFAGLIRMLARDPLPTATPLVPTLLLWGAEDGVATLDEAERIKASIPGAALSPIADCGHMPQLEASEVFVWQVHQFLENLSRPKIESRGAGMLGPRW